MYDNASTSPKKTMVQDLFSWNDVTYCLYNDLPRRYWGITATTPEGATLWHYDLPKGIYLSIGIQGKRILLQAMTYQPEGRIQQNCLLRLEPGTDIQVLQSQENSFRSRVFFVDDPTLLQIDSGIVEVWRITGSAVERTAVGTVTASSQLPHVNLVSKNTAALTGFDGTSISFIDMSPGPSGSMRLRYRKSSLRLPVIRQTQIPCGALPL